MPNSRGVQRATAVKFVNCTYVKKLKVKLTLQQAMKVQRVGGRGIAPLIPNSLWYRLWP
jgi:hypothetical protein